MSINPDQAIFDAIVAATSYDGGILINVQKFIDTFNGHRDRKLCTSLDVAQAAPDTLDHDITNILMSSADDSKRINQILDLMSRRSRGVAQTPTETLFQTPQDREYATDLLNDLDIKAVGPQLDISTQWFCKARVEQSMRLRRVAQTPPDQFMDDYKRDTTNAMAARILELEALHDEAVANAARWEQRFNDIAQTPRQMTDLVKRLNVYGTGSPDSLLLMREAAARIEELEAALRVQEPDGFANLRAIMADQPYRNSGLSVHEIEVILANKGGFMPDEATVWFREARGKLGIAPEQDK